MNTIGLHCRYDLQIKYVSADDGMTPQ